MELGEQIATLREEKTLTQVELAEKANISPSTLSQIESGRVPHPHVGTVRKIARALGVEPAELRKVSAEELASRPKGGTPLPSSSQSGEAERGRPEWFEALREQIMARAEKYGDEAADEASPHFQNATAASLWLERVQDELAMWSDFSLGQVAPFLPRRRFSGWKAIGDVGVWGPWLDAIGPLVCFDAASRDGERRLAAMSDVPDEIALKRLEKATTAADEARARLEDLRSANEA
jgi:transcriptional regulator with XRE-family HTH domain